MIQLICGVTNPVNAFPGGGGGDDGKRHKEDFFFGGVLILFSFLIRVLLIQGCYLCLNALTFMLMICKLI